MRIIYLQLIIIFLVKTALGQEPQPTPLQIQIPQGQPRSLCVSPDGNKLILETSDGKIHYFYEYTRNQDNWTNPVLVFKNPNIANPVYNHDNNKIYFQAQFDQDNTNLYYIQRLDSAWSEPIALQTLNSNENELSPTIDPFNGRIFFLRQNPKKRECAAIFYSVMKNNRWTTPKPFILPGLYGCEQTPRIFYDGHTMVFASKMPKTKSFDLYFIKEISDGIWYIPQKLPGSHKKLNEYSPTLDFRSGRLLFIQSKNNFKDAKPVWLPINQKIKPDPVFVYYGKIYNKDDSLPITNAQIDVLNPITNSPIHSYPANDKGQYQIFLQPNQNYILSFHGKHTTIFYKSFNKRKLDNITFGQLDVPLYKQVVLQLNVFDSAYFQPLDAQIDLINLSTGQIQTNIKKHQIDKGRYLISLPVGFKYRLKLKNQYYHTDSLDFDLSGIVIFPKYEKDIELISKTKRIVIHVVDAKTGQGVSTEIEIIDKTSNHRYKTKLRADNNGNVVLFLKKGSVYELAIKPKGYTFFTTTIDLEADNAPEKIEAKLQPLTEETKIEFHNITFETNSAELNESSYKELDRLVQLMKKNPEIIVEISAHTDDVGSEEYNMKLSLRRAQSVVNYLKQKGIPESRMVAQGYGETRPLVPNDSPEHRAMNRRVELRILKINK